MPTAYTQGYRPFVFADFSGGLNLRDKSDTVGDKEAIDLLNVTFTERGAIRQRDGFADLTTADLTNRVDSLAPFYTAAGVRQLIAGCGSRLEALDINGAVIAAQTGLTQGPYSFVRFGGPGAEYMYIANGADTLRRWNGTAWATPTATVNGTAASAMPRAGSVTVTATVPGTTSGSNAANRMIATAYGTQATAGPGGAATNPSRWYASNAGAPETWETDGASGRGRNFGDLTPGDGEAILAAVTWRELVFLFKETKFFVLWGESTAADGTPVFNFREVVNQTGLAASNAVAVGRDGVYFMNRRGVYRTTGGDPQLLSDIITPLWDGDPDVYYQGQPINLGQLDKVRMAWHRETLYVAVPTGVSTFNDRLLVHDTQHGWWSVYDIAASALAPFRRASQDELHHGYSTGPNRVGHRTYGGTTDRNLPIVSRWRSGWSDYNDSQVKTIRESKVWGSGAVIVSFSVDFDPVQRADIDTLFGLDATWPTVGTWDDWLATTGGLWPGAGQVTDRLIRYATRGIAFSTQFSNSSQASSWSVHRVARHLREIREPSVQ